MVSSSQSSQSSLEKRDLDAQHTFSDEGGSAKTAQEENIWDSSGNVVKVHESVPVEEKRLPAGLSQEQLDEFMDDVRYESVEV